MSKEMNIGKEKDLCCEQKIIQALSKYEIFLATVYIISAWRTIT